MEDSPCYNTVHMGRERDKEIERQGETGKERERERDRPAGRGEECWATIGAA